MSTGWVNDDAVVAAATELAATLGENPNHTVAAAAMDLEGTIYTGVNTYHFTGGPCAELVVVALAASANAGPLATIAAVGSKRGSVLAPCGRCRQVLLDQHPDCSVIVPTEKGLESVRVGQLLPYAFTRPEDVAERFMRFSGRYYDDVLAGRKTRTVRYRDPLPLGPTTFVFEDEQTPGFRVLEGVVESITPIHLSDLDGEYQKGLRGHYPGLQDNALLDDVRFHI
jgi:cytidine deaminase